MSENNLIPTNTASSKEEERLKVGTGSALKKKRNIVSDALSNAKEAAGNYLSTGKNMVSTQINKRKILKNLSSDFTENISGRKNQGKIYDNLSKMVKEGKYGDAKKYSKNEMTKIMLDPKTTINEASYTGQKMKKYHNL